MRTYLLNKQAKLQILEDNNISHSLTFEMSRANDSDFFKIVQGFNNVAV